MSLFTSVYTSITGLQAQSSALTTISNNLSNTSTTAYKTKGTSFEELVNYASTGEGVSASTSYNNDATGTISSADVSTYMAVDGSGYFAVKTATVNSDGSLTFSSDVYYTRDGDFTVDENGYLENSDGYYLLGWSVDTSSGDVTETLVPVQVSSLTNAPIATSAITYSANLPASISDGETTSATTVTVYDSLGNSHDVSYSWEKVSTSDNTWTLTITAAGGDSSSGVSGDYTKQVEFTFNSDGSIYSIDDADASGTSLSFDLSYIGADTQTITCDFSGTTQYASSSLAVETFSQNGVAQGDFSDVTIDTSGNVAIDYSNGQSVTYYEIPIATFLNSNGLEEVDGNAYKATTSSGSATYYEAGTYGAGTISSSALEESNVDIATELTGLVTAQQIYSANSKAITAADSMLETLTGLVR